MGVRIIPFTLGAMVVASVVAVDPGGLSPFGPARWWLTSTLMLTGGGLACWRPTRRLDRRSTRLWCALLVMLGVSALVNGDVRVALLGHPVRHLGLLTWALFALVFAAGQQLVRADDQRVVLRATVIAALGSGLWCVWELLAGAPIALATTSDRLTGPFGSAALLGAACCLLIPVCAATALDSSLSMRWRIAGAIGTGTNVIALVGSGTRAAWIGMSIAALLLALRRRPSRRLVLAAAGVVAVTLAVLAPRLGDVLDRSNGTASRLDEWAVAARVIGDHPLIGVGPEGYRIAAIGATDAAYERTYGRDLVLPDRAHSGPLDLAAIGGLPAAVVYVVLVGGIALLALRRVRTADAAMAGLCIALVAYAVQQVLLFPLAELDGVWWLFAGVLIASSPGYATDGDDDAVGSARAGEPAPHDVRDTRAIAVPPDGVRPGDVRPGVDAVPRRLRPVAFVALASAAVALVAGVLDVAADRQARRAVNTDDIDLAVTAAERAVDLRPDDLRYRSVAIEVHRARGTLADIDVALDHADDALRWSPDDPIALDARATLLSDRAAITGGPTDVGAAVDAWCHLVELDPVRARWQVQLGRAAALAGDVELARSALTTAAELRPDDATIASLLARLEANI